MHFRGKACIICKGAKRVDGGMDEDAGKQAAAAIKDRDQQKTDRDRKNDLAQVFHQIPAAAVDQINDMPDAEGHAGDDGRRLDIIFGDGREQQPAEDHLLQKADAEHTHDTADRPCRRVVDRDAVPQVPRRQNSERHIIEKPPGGYAAGKGRTASSDRSCG